MKPKINKTITTKGGGTIVIPKKIILKEYPDNEGGEEGNVEQEPNFLGCINSEDVIQFLDINRDGEIDNLDVSIAANNYSPSIANDCHYSASDVDDLNSFVQADLDNAATGLQVAIGSSILLFPLRLSSEGGERWAMVDFYQYVTFGQLQYTKYFIYDGKPNLTQKLVVSSPK